jgi:hypothetical protein
LTHAFVPPYWYSQLEKKYILLYGAYYIADAHAPPNSTSDYNDTVANLAQIAFPYWVNEQCRQKA